MLHISYYNARECKDGEKNVLIVNGYKCERWKSLEKVAYCTNTTKMKLLGRSL